MQRLKNLDVRVLRIGLIGVIAVVAIIVIGVSLNDDGDGSSNGAAALSEEALIDEAAAADQPIYWIGQRDGTDSYERTRTSDGRVYVRYLRDGAEAGDPRPEFVTVGTYPAPNAKSALATAKASTAGAKLVRRDGYRALTDAGPGSAYVVFDDQPDVQIEIFSPQPGEANILATSGALRPLQ